MNQPINWQQPVNLPVTMPRADRRTLKSTVAKAQLDAVEIGANVRLTEVALEGIAYLDGVRLRKAQSAEGNALMYGLLAEFAANSGKKIAHRNSLLGGL